MIIAFEGPDKTGKSTSATDLGCDGGTQYNMTKTNYEQAVAADQSEKGVVRTFDRIDWLTHMVYRLAMPTKEWNDERVRTVFGAPDAHLVFKLHHPNLAAEISDELYVTGDLVSVNEAYFNIATTLMMLNQQQHYNLFKTISILEVVNDPKDGSFSQSLIDFSSPQSKWYSTAAKLVNSNDTLLEFLQYEDQRISR